MGFKTILNGFGFYCRMSRNVGPMSQRCRSLVAWGTFEAGFGARVAQRCRFGVDGV
jgi:hypothetical protein